MASRRVSRSGDPVARRRHLAAVNTALRVNGAQRPVGLTTVPSAASAAPRANPSQRRGEARHITLRAAPR